jgi:serine/threonine protein kinase
MLAKSDLSEASKDLLRRLLEPSPQHRLKSLLALQRIAFFHNYHFDDVRQMKVSIARNEISLDANGQNEFIGAVDELLIGGRLDRAQISINHLLVSQISPRKLIEDEAAATARLLQC